MTTHYNLVCERCSLRLLKKGTTTTCPLSLEILQEMKINYKNEHGHKHPIKTVLTTCLGHCPEEMISYLEVRNNSVSEPCSYSANLEKHEIKDLFFN